MKSQKKWIAAMCSILLSSSMLTPAAFAVEVQSNEEMIYTFLTEELQLNAAVASGILANLYQESGFEPTASCIDSNHQISYGICQWNGARYADLQAFCSENGYAYDSLDGQLAYLENDLLTTYAPYYYDTLLNGFENSEDGAYEAAYSWAAIYEVCSTLYRSGRAELARDVFFPSYESYLPPEESPSDVGSDFYTTLQVGNDSKTLSITTEKQVQLQTESTPTQWHISKHDDGSYFLMQSEGRYYLNGQTDLLTVSEEPSRWWIYQTENGYVLQDAETEQVLQDSLALQDTDIDTGTAFLMQPLQTPAIVPLTVKTDTTQATFQWTAAADTDSYSLTIWNGTDSTQTPLQNDNCLQGSSFRTTLPAGTYTAVLKQINAAGTTTGEPITFIITEPILKTKRSRADGFHFEKNKQLP